LFETVGSQMAVRLSVLRAAAFYPEEDSWYSFQLEAEATPGRIRMDFLMNVSWIKLAQDSV
jgi:hypothetical protein